MGFLHDLSVTLRVFARHINKYACERALEFSGLAKKCSFSISKLPLMLGFCHSNNFC